MIAQVLDGDLVDGIHAFYFSLVPMSLILITLFFFKRETDRAGASGPTTMKLATK